MGPGPFSGAFAVSFREGIYIYNSIDFFAKKIPTVPKKKQRSWIIGWVFIPPGPGMRNCGLNEGLNGWLGSPTTKNVTILVVTSDCILGREGVHHKYLVI